MHSRDQTCIDDSFGFSFRYSFSFEQSKGLVKDSKSKLFFKQFVSYNFFNCSIVLVVIPSFIFTNKIELIFRKLYFILLFKFL